LDVGCGRGEFAGLALTGSIDEGVDLSASDLDFARRTGCYRQLSQADARSLPYPDGTFRSVLSISVLEHVQQPDLAVREIHRVLAPGGLFVATVVLKEIHDHLAIASAFQRYGFAALADAYFRVHDRLFRHVCLFSQRQWEELLSEAGFEPVRRSRVVSRRVVRWWEGLMWLAWPYRVWRCAGDLLARKPRWLARWLNRRFERLMREEDDEGACLFIVAQKPHGPSNAEVRAEPDWERERAAGDENQALALVSVCGEARRG
jgi:SAM-dependent methyltransferase